MKVRDPARSDSILETAADLFGESGYNAVRMEDIATRAGVAKGTLYLYFKNKDDLFLALILRRMTDLLQQIRHKASTAATPEAKLKILVHECIDYFSSQPHIFAVLEKLDHTGSESQVEALRASRHRFLQFTASIIVEFKGTGRAADVDPELASRILCSMMRELLFQPPANSADLSEQIVDLFLHGISTRQNH
jgi:TetR/AcrR family fatty acid metabolism transcriptional regulator